MNNYQCEVLKYSILPPDNCKKLYYYDEKLHENADFKGV